MYDFINILKKLKVKDLYFTEYLLEGATSKNSKMLHFLRFTRIEKRKTGKTF